jgi:uncharacterized protein YndB with AHSA1/START domain
VAASAPSPQPVGSAPATPLARRRRDPPERIVVAWQITESGGDWVYDPDASHGSEFEVTFTSQPDGQTLVELEHRHIERHGSGAASIHRGVTSPGGWSSVLDAYAKVASAA